MNFTETAIESAKEQALAQHLNVSENEVDELRDGEVFEADSEPGEYLVLTEEEADDKAREEIEETLWAFNKSFLDSHSEGIASLSEEGFKAIQNQCEGANPAIRAMIDDLEHFADDAIATDGKAHFLANYDHEEHEEKVNGEWFFIYRIA